MRRSCSERSGRRRVAALLAPLGLLLAPACATLTPAEERELGAQVAAQMRAEMRLLRDRVVSRYVRDLGQEILEAAQSEVPRLGIATVYRNVRALLEEGWLQVVDLPGAPSRYEMADKDHHHHFHCRSCDSVYDIEDCPGSLKELTPRGYRLESHEIILYGLCSGCAS